MKMYRVTLGKELFVVAVDLLVVIVAVGLEDTAK